MSASFTIIGTAIFAVLAAGYIAQTYYKLPPPPPRIAGIDLGTTFSSVGIYQAVTGDTDIIPDARGKRSVPSVVAFLPNGTVLVGTSAVEQQELNPKNTIYDAKRFIGKTFKEGDLQFEADRRRYPFTIGLEENGSAYFVVETDKGTKKISPEEVGAMIVRYLRTYAEEKYGTRIRQLVISVPAEFDQDQRNATGRAAELAGMEVRRIVSEPTAAAMAYGLHKKPNVEFVIAVDMGGGTLDVSVLWIQGGVFVTQAMAGNNRLGGQDLNERIQRVIAQKIRDHFGKELEAKEDIQQLRLAIEAAKIELSTLREAWIRLNLHELGKYDYLLTRDEFESVNADLFESILEPVRAAMEDCNLKPSDIDEIVLVGGSTRIPKVRQVVGSFFGKAPNYGIDPELAVVTGAAVQAGVIGGGWPLQVAAMELPVARRKRHVFTAEQKELREQQAADKAGAA